MHRLYAAATSQQRAILREAHQAGELDGPKIWRHPTDYNRSDLTREQQLRRTLIAMSIRDGGCDERDDLMSIAYCYHNLTLLSVDGDAVLEKIAEISAPKFAGTLRGFLRRTPQEKSLHAWRLKIEQTPNGPVADFMF